MSTDIGDVSGGVPVNEEAMAKRIAVLESKLMGAVEALQFFAEPETYKQPASFLTNFAFDSLNHIYDKQMYPQLGMEFLQDKSPEANQ